MKYDNLPNQIKLRDYFMAMNEEFRLLSLMSVLCFDILYRQSINLINKKFIYLLSMREFFYFKCLTRRQQTQNFQFQEILCSYKIH